MYPGRWSTENAETPAVIMAGSRAQLTYAELEDKANRLAHLFRAQGLRKGDHVAFFMENSLELVVAFCAAERTGLYYTPIDAKFSVEEVSFIVNDCAAKVVVTSNRMAEVAHRLTKVCPAVERWLMTGAEGFAAVPYEDFDGAISLHESDAVNDEQLGAAMFYSSGTTGRPKGVWRPISDVEPGGMLPAVRFAQELYRVTEGCTFLVPGPLHHAMGLMPVGTTLRCGGTVVVMERFDAAQLAELVDDLEVTHVIMVPTMASRLVKLPAEVRAEHRMRSLRALTMSGAPCPPAVKQELIEWAGPIVHDIYGGSEGAGLCVSTSEDALSRPGTVGRAMVGELVIRRDDGSECDPAEIGQVWFRGGTPFAYFGDAEKTAGAHDESGELATMGDIGYVDNDGYLFLTDRVAFTIISGGVNIYPQEIENVLLSHPLVSDVAVIGVPDEDKGEQVKAIVELVEDVAGDGALAEDLIEYAGSHLARYKRPRTVDFVAEIPRNSTGKIDKRALRRTYAKDQRTEIR